MDLRASRVLVTGAAHGLGLALAREFAARGAHVILTDRNVPLLEEAAARLRADGRSVEAHPLDVTDAAAIVALRERLLDTGPVDVLVNNAGVVFGGGFADVPLERHQATIGINVGGLVAMTHAFLPHLESRPRAAILNICSASAFIGLPYATTYAASKWAVLGFSESLDEELRERGRHHVRVSALCPSYITTGLFAGARPSAGTWLLTAEGVARAGVRMVERRGTRLILPWTAGILLGGFGWLPRPVFHALARLFGVSRSMAQWRGH
ncbi:MAG TPA: SDR family NAD(P)-dependent oxidoreductase [Gemmatimonadales bacterium]|nr:SDR family NAD(P)-dependent oxidoreductase [Gemmatimonadales bacterium]